MATSNNFRNNTSQIVLKKFVEAFSSDLVLLNTVDRQIIQGELNPNTGDTVWLKRPHAYNTIRTPDGDISGMSPQAMISGKVPAKVSNFCTVDVGYKIIEEALELNQLDEILKPVASHMAAAVEAELAKFIIANSSLVLGSPGTAISKWSDIAQVGSYLKDLGVDFGENFAVVDPWVAMALADAQGGLHAADNLVTSAWKLAQISRPFGGVSAIMSNALPTRTSSASAGAAGLTVLSTPVSSYDSVKDTYQMTVVLTGATAGLKAGDILEFDASNFVNQHNKSTLYRDGAPIKFTGTVTKDAALAGADVTVTISGPAVFDPMNPQYNTVDAAVVAGATVNVLGTADTAYKPGIFLNSKAVAFGSVVLPKLHGEDSSVMYDAKSGLSIRVTKYSDARQNVNMIRFDLLPSFAMLQPFAAGQLFGNA